MVTVINVTSPTVEVITTSSGLAVKLLWLPYVVLTIVLLSLLVASFVHFHWKYRDRYAKRVVLAKIERSDVESQISGMEGSLVISLKGEGTSPYPEENHSGGVGHSETLSAPHTQSGAGMVNKTRRLKMFYGNKVDVGLIVKRSVMEKRDSTQHLFGNLNASKSGSVASLTADPSDLDPEECE